jgi:hypothetical protein
VACGREDKGANASFLTRTVRQTETRSHLGDTVANAFLGSVAAAWCIADGCAASLEEAVRSVLVLLSASVA